MGERLAEKQHGPSMVIEGATGSPNINIGDSRKTVHAILVPYDVSYILLKICSAPAGVLVHMLKYDC